MSIPAVFIDTTSFSVTDDLTNDFQTGRGAEATCGVDGIKYAIVSSSTYDSTADLTTVILSNLTSALTPNLATVKYGIVGKGRGHSLPVHDHDSALGEGGILNGYSPLAHLHTGETLENDGITPDSATLTVTGQLDLATVGTHEYKLGGNRALAMPIDNTNLAIGPNTGTVLAAGAEGNILIGSTAAPALTTGGKNFAVGYQSLYHNETGSENVALGYQALWGRTGNSMSYTIGVGYQTGYDLTTGEFNTFFGYQAGYTLTTGSNNFMMGYQAGYSSETSSNSIYIGFGAGYREIDSQRSIFIGTEAGYGSLYGATKGQDDSIFIGYRAGYIVADHSKNIGIGSYAMTNYYTGFNNFAIGTNAMYNIRSGNYNVVIGTNAMYGAVLTTNVDFNVAIGYNTLSVIESNAEYNIAIGSSAMSLLKTGTGNIGIGDNALRSQVTGTSNIAIGHGCYYGGSSDSSSTRNTLVGHNSMRTSRKNNDDNTMVGFNTAYSCNGIDRSTFIGSYAGYGVAGDAPRDLTIVGAYAGYSVYTSDYSVFIGAYAGYNASALDNTILIGYQSGYSMTTTSNNIYIGHGAGYGVVDSANSVVIGYQAGYTDNEGSNIFIGYQAGYNETGANKLYIANSNTATPLIYGEFDNNFITINGDLYVTGDIYDGTCKIVCDYVFDKYFDGKVKDDDEDIEIKTIGETVKYIEEERHLPTMPGRVEIEKERKSNGELIRKLWETVEVQSLYIKELHERLEKLETKN